MKKPNYISVDYVDANNMIDDGMAQNMSKFVGPFANLSVSTLITAVILALVGFFAGLACVISALHRIKEGHVGKESKTNAWIFSRILPNVSSFIK